MRSARSFTVACEAESRVQNQTAEEGNGLRFIHRITQHANELAKKLEALPQSTESTSWMDPGRDLDKTQTELADCSVSLNPKDVQTLDTTVMRMKEWIIERGIPSIRTNIELEQQQTRFESLQSISEDFETQITRLKLEVSESKETKLRLDAKLAAALKQEKSLQDRVSHLESDLQDSQTLKEDNRALEAVIEQKNATEERLKRDLDALEDEKKSLASTNKQFQTQSITMEDRVAHLQQQLQSMKSRLDSSKERYRVQLDSQEETIADLKRQREAWERFQHEENLCLQIALPTDLSDAHVFFVPDETWGVDQSSVCSTLGSRDTDSTDDEMENPFRLVADDSMDDSSLDGFEGDGSESEISEDEGVDLEETLVKPNSEILAKPPPSIVNVAQTLSVLSSTTSPGLSIKREDAKTNLEIKTKPESNPKTISSQEKCKDDSNDEEFSAVNLSSEQKEEVERMPIGYVMETMTQSRKHEKTQAPNLDGFAARLSFWKRRELNGGVPSGNQKNPHGGRWYKVVSTSPTEAHRNPGVVWVHRNQALDLDTKMAKATPENDVPPWEQPTRCRAYSIVILPQKNQKRCVSAAREKAPGRVTKQVKSRPEYPKKNKDRKGKPIID